MGKRKKVFFFFFPFVFNDFVRESKVTLSSEGCCCRKKLKDGLLIGESMNGDSSGKKKSGWV